MTKQTFRILVNSNLFISCISWFQLWRVIRMVSQVSASCRNKNNFAIKCFLSGRWTTWETTWCNFLFISVCRTFTIGFVERNDIQTHLLWERSDYCVPDFRPRLNNFFLVEVEICRGTRCHSFLINLILGPSHLTNEWQNRKVWGDDLYTHSK